MSPGSDDVELVRASLGGSVSAFAEIVERHLNSVCAVAYSACGDLALSEDVAQEVFVTAWRDLGRLRDPSRLRGWLCSVARNRARDAVRKRRRETEGGGSGERAPDEQPASAPSPLERALTRESEDLLWDALRGLPERYREPLVLYYREEKSVRQVAAGLGLTIDAAKQRLSRGRQALKEKLSQVEEALVETRPSKAFTVGVIALVAARAGVASAAESAPQGTGASAGGGSVGKTAVLLLGAAVLAGALLFESREGERSPKSGDRPPSTSKPAPPRWRAHPRLPPDPEGSYRLEGRVVDLLNRPVRGATVTLSSNPARVALSDDEGRFEFGDLVARSYGVSARAGGAASRAIGVRVGPETEPVLLRLRPGSTLELTVIDAETRAPIEGASVEVSSGLSTLEGATARDGVASFAGLTSTFAEVEASAEGYGSMAFVLMLTGEPGRNWRTMALQRGPPLAGAVIDPGGRPIEGAEVDLVASRHPSNQGRARSDREGRFLVPAIAPGEYILTVSHPEFATLTRPFRVSRAEALEDVELVLESGRAVSGRVRAEDGRPVPAAWVRVLEEGEHKAALTDDDGRFEIAGLPRGEVTLVAENRGRSSAPTVVDLSGAEGGQAIELTIADHSIRGVVVDDRGAPVVGAIVRSSSTAAEVGEIAAFPEAVGVTSEGGAFHLGPLSPEEAYELRAVPPEVPESYAYLEEMAPVRARPGEHRVRLVVEPPGQIAGEVRLPDRSAPEEFAVSVAHFPHGLAGSASTPFSGTGGSFALAAVPAGTYVLELSATGARPALIEEIEVNPGELTDLGRVELERGRDMSGLVVDRSGAPVAGARVFVGDTLSGDGRRLSAPAVRADRGADPYAPDQPPLRAAVTDESGTFSVANTYSRWGFLLAAAEHPERGRSAVKLVKKDDQRPLELVLHAPGSIEGEVAGGEGPTEVWASPVLEGFAPGRSPVYFVAPVDAEGRYELERLAAGTYELVAVDLEAPADPSPDRLARVELAAGARARRDLKVLEGSTPPWDEEGFARLERKIETLCGCEGPPCRQRALRDIDAILDRYGALSPAAAQRLDELHERLERCAPEGSATRPAAP